jgi:hypothetical protein
MEGEERFSLRDTNEIQRELILKAGGESVALEWIKKYSARFRQLISEHPELVNEYRTDPALCIGKVKSLLEDNENESIPHLQ